MNDWNSLFRDEAIQHKLRSKQAEVLLQRNTVMQPLLWLLCVCFLAIVLLINQIEYKEVESARGHLVTEEAGQQLVAPKAGLLHAIFVATGESVKEGDTVAQISQQLYDQAGRPLSERDRQSLTLQMNALKREQELYEQNVSQRYTSLDTRSADLVESVRIAYEALQMLREQEQISAGLVRGTEALLARDAVSRAQASQQQLAHLDLLRERKLAESQLHQLQADLRESVAAKSALALEAQAKQHSLEKEIRLLDLQLASVKTMPYLSVLANRAGVVSSIPLEPGAAVRQGQALIYLQAENQPLVAEVFVPSRILGKLAPGQDVMLRYDAFDVHAYGRYPATISSIERSALDPRQHLLPVAQNSEPLFRVLAKPAQHYVEGEDIYPLQAGLQLSADFVGDELSLLQYIFKPLLSLRGKVS